MFKFTRTVAGYAGYAVTHEATGAKCFVHRTVDGKAWIAWQRGKNGTPARTRVAACEALLGLSERRDAAWAARMGQAAQRTAAAKRAEAKAARDAAWAAHAARQAARYEGLDEILAELDWPTRTPVQARIVLA